MWVLRHSLNTSILSLSIQRDNDPAFTPKVVELISKVLNISWKLHILCPPQSLRAKGLIKQLSQLSLELRLPWPSCQPPSHSMLSIGLAPLSPCMDGCSSSTTIWWPRLPHWLATFPSLVPHPFTCYTLSWSPHQGLSHHQTCPFSPGDWMSLKQLSSKLLEPKWTGPHT